MFNVYRSESLVWHIHCPYWAQLRGLVEGFDDNSHQREISYILDNRRPNLIRENANE